MSSWSLRLARTDDAEAFHAVEIDAAGLLLDHPSLAGIDLPPPGQPDSYRTMIRHGHCLTVTSAGRIVGFAATRPYRRELHLHELSVAREFQRLRIGSTLLEALKIDAKNTGLRAITLETFRDIAWNAPFYERHGFAMIDDLASHPRLAGNLERAVAAGLPRERRCAMICPIG